MRNVHELADQLEYVISESDAVDQGNTWNPGDRSLSRTEDADHMEDRRLPSDGNLEALIREASRPLTRHIGPIDNR